MEHYCLSSHSLPLFQIIKEVASVAHQGHLIENDSKSKQEIT